MATEPAAQPQGRELLPCPWCGQHVKAIVIKGANYSLVGCGNLNCPASTIACDPVEWNARADLPRATAEWIAETTAREFVAKSLLPNDKQLELSRNDYWQRAKGAELVLERLRATPRATGETTVEVWQPIETAPRDGSAILVHGPELLREIDGHCAVVRWRTSGYSTIPWWTISDGKFGPHDLRGPSPTHWQPLPVPPDRAVTRTEGEGEK